MTLSFPLQVDLEKNLCNAFRGNVKMVLLAFWFFKGFVDFETNIPQRHGHLFLLKSAKSILGNSLSLTLNPVHCMI